MAGQYSPQSLGINAPSGGFQQGGWYSGRQYWGGTLSDPGVINPLSNQQGAGKAVSNEVNAQSAAKQNVSPQQLNTYIQQQNQKAANVAPVSGTPDTSGGGGLPSDQAGSTPGAGVGGTGNVTGSGIGGLGIAPPATIDLAGIYKSLTASSGIPDKEKQLTDATNAFNDAQSKINDNPFLSESDRVGRIQKLQTDYNNNTKSLNDAITMAKQDVQTQLDLQTKQFDINSQAAQQAFSQFQTLLSSGALDNASGSDIASITAATGMSSGMIQSAIAATKAKDQKTNPMQVIQFNDGTNQGFAVIDPQTGDIIKKQVIAGAAPTKYNGGDTGTPADATATATKNLALEKEQAPQVLLAGAKSGKTLPDMMAYGSSMGLTAQQIYNIYHSVNYYHATASQQKGDKKQFNVK